MCLKLRYLRSLRFFLHPWFSLENVGLFLEKNMKIWLFWKFVTKKESIHNLLFCDLGTVFQAQSQSYFCLSPLNSHSFSNSVLVVSVAQSFSLAVLAFQAQSVSISLLVT